jgi:Protein of unknown function (DUF3617)
MKTRLILGAAALALAGCGSSQKPAGGNAAGDSVSTPSGSASAAGAGAAGGGNLIRPGEWETKVETVEVDAPGMPAQVKQMMANAMGGSKMTVRDCVTPEEARRPNADLFAGKDRGNCTSKDFSMSGGRLRGTISCPAGNGRTGSMTMAMDGRFGPDSYTVSQNITTDAAGSKMTIKARVTGRRVGECAKEG